MIVALIVLLGIAAALNWRKAMAQLAAEDSFLTQLLQEVPANREAAQTLLQAHVERPAARVLLDSLMSGRAEIDGLPYLEWNATSRYLTGIFVFLGLLGTVWGIALAIQSLGGTITSSAPTVVSNSSQASEALFRQSEQLRASIASLLSGIQSASWSTLAGVAATLGASALNFVYAGRARGTADRVERIARETLLPLPYAEEPIKMQSLLKSLQRSSGRLTDATALLSDRIEAAADAVQGIATQTWELTSRLSATTGALEGTLQRLGDERNALRALANEISASATQMAREVRLLRENLAADQRAQGERHDRANEHLHGTQRELQALLRRFESVLNDAAAQAEASPLRREMLDLKAELAALTARLDRASEEAARQGQTLPFDIADGTEGDRSEDDQSAQGRAWGTRTSSDSPPASTARDGQEALNPRDGRRWDCASRM